MLIKTRTQTQGPLSVRLLSVQCKFVKHNAYSIEQNIKQESWAIAKITARCAL